VDGRESAAQLAEQIVAIIRHQYAAA
jgi:hypothetical protein